MEATEAHSWRLTNGKTFVCLEVMFKRICREELITETNVVRQKLSKILSLLHCHTRVSWVVKYCNRNALLVSSWHCCYRYWSVLRQCASVSVFSVSCRWRMVNTAVKAFAGVKASDDSLYWQLVLAALLHLLWQCIFTFSFFLHTACCLLFFWWAILPTI